MLLDEPFSNLDVDLRERLVGAPYYRLIHAEADGIPGLIADRYGDVLVLQPIGQVHAEPVGDQLRHRVAMIEPRPGGISDPLPRRGRSQPRGKQPGVGVEGRGGAQENASHDQ